MSISKPSEGDTWWKDAYANQPHIDVQYELKFNADVIKPGNKIMIKNFREIFLFRCVAHNVATDTTWIDCINTVTGDWRSFRISKIKGLVKPKKSRRKKAISA